MKITFAICVALLIGFAGKAILYPDMPLDRFAYLGAARISWLVREQTGLLTPYDARDDRRTELANIRAMFPDVSGTDLERALAIRDAVHTRTRIGNSPAGYDRRNLDQFVYLAVEDPDSGFLCQGISDVYVLVMEAFGIQTRRVDLYAKSKNAPTPVKSHATVEVKIDGRWIAVDPTYAFSIFHDGQRIDWTEAREIMLSGGKVDFRHDGVKPKIPRIELSRVVRFLVKPDKVLPADWDGVIRYANGQIARVFRP